MRWPWQREPAPQPDVSALVRQEVETALSPLVERFALNQQAYGLPDPTGRPPDGLPYRWNNPWRYTVQQAPYKPPNSPVTISTLRAMADVCDILRAAILHLTREVQAVPIKVVPRDPKDKGDETQRRCKEALAWLNTRQGGLGGVGSRRAHFEAQCIDDLCIVGPAAVFWQKNRRGELLEVIAIDAETIRPQVDIYGWDTRRPYQQWVYGVAMRDFTRDELTYDGVWAKTYSPYFTSPTEYLINVVDTDLAADQWNKAWLTEGTGSTEKLALPADWTPEQVMNFQSYWTELLKGNINARQRTLFVPSGTTKLNDLSRKDQDFQEFSLYLMRRICSILGVQPASLGYAGEQYKVSQDKSLNTTTQFGVGVLLEWFRALYDEVLERLGYDDLCVQHVSGEEESEGDRATRITTLVAGTVMTPNEARAIEGLDGIGPDGDTLLVPSTLQPLEHALIPPPDPMELATVKTKALSEGKQGTPAAQRVEGADDRDRMLADWQRLSLKRLAAGKSAEFVFKGLPDDLSARVYAGLINCRDADAVKAVFAAMAASE